MESMCRLCRRSGADPAEVAAALACAALGAATGTVRAHLRMRGRVQGVHYRETARQQAVPRNLAGWIRNLEDGSVEAVFQGEREQVEALIAWCHFGSPNAYVKEILVALTPLAAAELPFRVLPGCD